MARIADFEKARKQRKRRLLVRNIVLFTIFAALVLFVIGVMQQVGNMDLRTIYNDLRAEISSGSGFPAELPGRVLRIDPVSDAVLLTGDTNIYGFNASARQILNMQHGMSAQMNETSKDRLLLYDRGGNKVSIFSKSTQVLSFTSNYAIYSADIADNGNFALVTTSEEHLMRVTVYNKNGEDIFIWKSAEKPVIRAALSDSRDTMMVGCVDAVDGSFVSSISKFQFSIDQEMAHADLHDELLLHLDYASANLLRVITDQRIILFNSDLKELASFQHSGTLDYFSSAPGKPLAVTLGNYSQDHQVTVVVFDDALAEQARFTVEYPITAFDADAHFIYIASQNHVDIYQLDGTLAHSQEIQNLHDIHPNGAYLYYITGAVLDRIDTAPLRAVPESSASESVPEQTASSSEPEPPPESAPSEPDEDESSGSELSVLPDDDDLSSGDYLVQVGDSSEGEDEESGTDLGQ